MTTAISSPSSYGNATLSFKVKSFENIKLIWNGETLQTIKCRLAMSIKCVSTARSNAIEQINTHLPQVIVHNSQEEKRYISILILLTLFLYAKWNIWQINFNLIFVFALATLNSYAYFCIGNTIGILTDNLLVATVHMLCLVFAFLSNAVIEWIFSHVTSVLKMWKICDYECV